MLPRVQRRPELKSNTVFLLRQLETHSKVSTVHNDQNVCSFTPLKEHTEKRPTKKKKKKRKASHSPSLLPKSLPHYLGPPGLQCWDLRNPELCRMCRKDPGAPPDDSMLWLQMPWTLEESWRIMHCKFTDSSNGTSLQSKQN